MSGQEESVALLEKLESVVLHYAERGQKKKQSGPSSTGIQAFISIGRALREIKEKNLHLHTHHNMKFHEYCAAKFGYNKAWAGHIIAAAEVAEAFELVGADHTELTYECQARALLSFRRDPSKMLEIWRAAQQVNRCPTYENIRDTADKLYPNVVRKKVKIEAKPRNKHEKRQNAMKQVTAEKRNKKRIEHLMLSIFKVSSEIHELVKNIESHSHFVDEHVKGEHPFESAALVETANFIASMQRRLAENNFFEKRNLS